MTPEETLRQELHAAVDDINPSPDGAEDLRARLGALATPAPVQLLRQRWLVVGAAAAAVVVVAASVTAFLNIGRADEKDKKESRVATTPSPSTTEQVVSEAPTTSTSAPGASTTVQDAASATTTAGGRRTVATPGTTPAPTTTVATSPGTWRNMAAAPGEANGAAVWTGHELVLWSGSAYGDPAGSANRGGVAYRAATDTWRTIAHGPLLARRGHSGVWSGREILYWGGSGASGALADGAALDPASGAWRAIAASPIGARMSHQAVWTGKEMVVWGGYETCCPIDSTIHDASAAAYDPAAREWRRLADVPAPWSGDDGPAVTFAHEGDVFVWRRGHLGRLDMARNEWRDLGGPPARPTNCGFSGGPLSLGALVGQRFFVWYGQCEVDSGAVYDIAAGAWTEIPDPPKGMIEVEGADHRALALFGGSAVSELDPSSGAWGAPIAPPAPLGFGPLAKWTGTELLVWGGSRDGTERRNGAAYRPS